MEHCDTMDMPQQNRDGDIETVKNSCARVNENEKPEHFSSQPPLVPNATASYNVTLYDSLPVDDTVIGNMQLLTDNINADKQTNSCVPSNDDQPNDDKRTKERSDDMQSAPSALSQLLNYGVSDTEDSESDSDESVSANSTNDNNVTPCLTETNASDQPPVVQSNFRENDSSSDSSSTSEYESDSSSSYSDVGACGVTPAAPEKKQSTEKYSAPRTKGELSMDELPPIEDLKISVAEEECIEIGVVSSIIDQLVIVQSLPGTPAYDLDTLLFLERGNRPLGRVFDVIGPVTEPFYAVRFNTCEQALESGAKPGTPVYCAPHTQHTSYVFVSELMKLKGSDASWEHNNEPPAMYLDYSDDEEERKARRMQRSKGTQAVDTPKSSSLERNKKFEKQMNDKNLLITERYKNQQPPARKKKPETSRPPAVVNAVVNGGGAVPAQPPPWMVHNPSAPMPPRPEFWSAPPYHFAAYPQYGPVPMYPNLGPRQPFVPSLMGPAPTPAPPPAAVFHGPPQHFNPNIPPPIMRPQPVSYFPNPRHPRWVTPGLGVLQPPRGNFGNGSSYTH